MADTSSGKQSHGKPARLPIRRWRRGLASLGALTLTVSLLLGGIGSQPTPAVADEIVLIRPGDTRPDQRIDVNGSLIAVTHTENAAQAEAVFFQGAREQWERAPTSPGVHPYGLFLTYDMDGRAALIVLDLSWLRSEDDLGFVNLMLYEPHSGPGASAVRNTPGLHESIQLLLHPQEDGTFLAREYRELAKGSEVNNTDWGLHEAYTTRDDSIDARVHNVPDDDEAMNQGDRFDQKGRRVKEDDN